MKVKGKMKGSTLKKPEGMKKSGAEKKKLLKIVSDRQKAEDLVSGSTAEGAIVSTQQETKKKKKKKKKKKVLTDPTQANQETSQENINGGESEEVEKADTQTPDDQPASEVKTKKRKNKRKEMQKIKKNAQKVVGPGDNKNTEGDEKTGNDNSKGADKSKEGKAKKRKNKNNTQGEGPGNKKQRTEGEDENGEADESKEGKVNKKKEKKKNYVLFLGNLPYEIDEGEVEEHFKIVKNSIKRVTLLTNRATGKNKGCGFIEVSTAKAYEDALKLNLSKLQDHKIRVEFTVPGKKKSDNRNKFIKMKTRKILGQSKKGKKKRNKK